MQLSHLGLDPSRRTMKRTSRMTNERLEPTIHTISDLRPMILAKGEAA